MTSDPERVWDIGAYRFGETAALIAGGVVAVALLGTVPAVLSHVVRMGL